MLKRINSSKRLKILDEIIDNAIELPLESQNLLLILAKGMAYTKACTLKQIMLERSNKAFKDTIIKNNKYTRKNTYERNKNIK